MPRLIWSHHALLDVQRLYRVLAENNIDAAKRAIKTIRHGVKILGRQPHLGRPVQHMPGEFREWLVDFGDSGYLVRYRVESDAVTVLAIRHQREAGF